MAKLCKYLTMIICSIFFIQSMAFADTGKIGKEMTIEGECSFTIKAVRSYDVFFNQESGTSKQWIIASFELLNWRDDSFYVKTETNAKIVYDEDFEYESNYLWPNPEGTYFRADGDEWLKVYLMDDNGKIYTDGEDANGGYATPRIKYHNGYERKYNPIDVCFEYENEGPNNSKTYKSQDSSKTVLDPLVKRTFHYVFLVPDIVAEEEGLRELIFTIGGEEYSYRF